MTTTVKGVRLWVPASDLETFVSLANPDLNREEVIGQIQTMQADDWLFLFKRVFALAFSKSNNYIQPAVLNEGFLLNPAKEEEPPDAVDAKPNLDNLDDLDFD